jgi:tetratricopeptide (TPR) repeat protein
VKKGVKILIAAACFAAIGFAFYGCAVKNASDDALAYFSEGETHFNNARSYHYLGEHKKATLDLNKAIDSYKQAIASFSKAIKLDPAFASAYQKRGESYIDQQLASNQIDYLSDSESRRKINGYEAGIADLDKALKLDPNNAKAYRLRGSAYLYLSVSRSEHINFEDTKKAILDLDMALRLDPNDENAYQIRVNTSTLDGEWESAFYDKAINLNPNDAASYGLRGIANAQKGEKGKALADFDKAIALDPKLIWVYCELAKRYNYSLFSKEDKKEIEDLGRATGERYNGVIIIKDDKKAIAYLDRAIELNPNYAIAYYSRAISHHDLGEYEKAIADIDRAIKLKPNDAFAYASRGSVYMKLNDRQKAIASYTRAIEINSDFTQAYRYRASVYAELKEYKKAIADLGKAIKINDESDMRSELGLAADYCKRAEMYKNIGDINRSNDDAKKARELDKCDL